MESSELNEMPERAEGRLEAFAESDRRLRRIADAIPGLVSYVDRHRRYLFVNRMYESWFGRARSEVTPQDAVPYRHECIVRGRKGARW